MQIQLINMHAASTSSYVELRQNHTSLSQNTTSRRQAAMETLELGVFYDKLTTSLRQAPMETGLYAFVVL